MTHYGVVGLVYKRKVCVYLYNEEIVREIRNRIIIEISSIRNSHKPQQ